MASKQRPRKKSVKVGPRIVRAWFDTVINPLLSSLRVEKEYLERKDWTWQFKPGRLESVRPIYSMVSFEDNLEQFLEFYPHLNETLSDYENKSESLLTNCKELHRVLKGSPEFLVVIQKVSAEKHEPNTYGSNSFVDYSPEDIWAEHTVNYKEKLPSHYRTGRLWKMYKDEFLAVLDSNGVSTQHKKTNRAGQALLSTVEQLIKHLKEIREELSLGHDMPYVSASPVFVE